MKVTIIPNLTRVKAKDITAEICSVLHSMGAECYTSEELKNENISEYLNYGESDDIISASDAVIAVGGDGAIIHAAKEAVKHSKPILGINAGRLAYMAGLENNELDKLNCLIEGKYTIDKRLMLKTTVYTADEKVCDFALNDCYVTNNHKQRMSNVHI